jgi:AraC family transcriptional regulator of adaptative response/methylated-DNA-[protein]-cysteine methyltransferase
VADRIFSGGGRTTLDVRGTNFQIRVWEALLRIPEGALTTYGDLARAVGVPRGARAVGSAVARNPISYLIPCHRVIRATGVLGDYRWGSARKKAMVGREAAVTLSDERGITTGSE